MNLFELCAKITADSSDFDSKMGGVSEGFSGISAKAVAVGNLISDAVEKAGSMIVDLAKEAVNGYADYEQLVGGVQKLYGNMGQSLEEYAEANGGMTDKVKAQWQQLEDAQNLVLKNANEAYKNAGMSANEYMETATSFSAALISSLNGDTVKAAEQTEVAMEAISDNVNTFGSNMEDVTNAFKGFSKQNYTMLDNLKLGYGGTQEEMKRLISDANTYAKSIGKASNLSISSFSDIVTAIELIQEKQSIAGTTAREAATTISGSIQMTKTAWENLVAGLGNKDADLSSLINNVVTSAETVFNNVLPIAEQALIGIGNFVATIIPTVVDKIPSMLSAVLPSLVSSAGQLVTSLAQAFMTGVPALMQTGVELLQSLASGMAENVSTLLEKALPMLVEFSANLRANAGEMISAGLELIVQLAQGIIDALPTIIETVPTIIDNIVNIVNDNAPKMIETGLQLIVMLVSGLIQAMPVIIENMPKIIKCIWDTISAVNWLNLGSQIITAFKNGIVALIPALKSAGGSIKDGIINAIKALPQGLSNIAKNAAKSMVTAFKSVDWKALGLNIIKGLVNGIKNNVTLVVKAIKSVAQSALGAIKDFFGIHSPSTVMRDQIGKMIDEGWAEGIEGNSYAVEVATKSTGEKVQKTAAEQVAEINSKIYDLYDYGGGAADLLAEKFQTAYAQVGDASAIEYASNSVVQYAYDLARLSGSLDDIATDSDAVLSGQLSIAEAEEKIAEAAKKAYTELESSVNASIEKQIEYFDKFEKNTEKVNIKDLLSNMQSQIEGITKWTDSFTELAAKGVSEPLLKYLESLGLDGQKYIEAFKNASSEEIQKANALFATEMQLPDSATQSIMGAYVYAAGVSVGGFTNTIIAEASEAIAAGTAMGTKTANAVNTAATTNLSGSATKAAGTAATTTISSGIESGTKATTTEATEFATAVTKTLKSDLSSSKFIDIGKQIASGIAQGIRNGQSIIQSAIDSLASSTISAARSAFQIHSPSKVMSEQVGKYLPLGMAAGISSYADSAVSAMQNVASAVTDAAAFGVNGSGTFGSGVGSVNAPVTINVYGAEGQSSQDIAERVADIINNQIYRQRAAFA